MKQTSNYQLPQWETTDRVLMSDFNGMTEKIDTALQGLDTRLTAGEQTITKMGNCVIQAGSYCGQGGYGQDHPVVLTFDHRPLFLVLDGPVFMFSGQSLVPSEQRSITTSWSDKSVSWYSNLSSDDQFNQSYRWYHYIAFLKAE